MQAAHGEHSIKAYQGPSTSWTAGMEVAGGCGGAVAAIGSKQTGKSGCAGVESTMKTEGAVSMSSAGIWFARDRPSALELNFCGLYIMW